MFCTKPAPPIGYLLAEDVKFTVKDSDEAITVVMKDRPKDHPGTPNTGDTGWRLALAVFGVSLGGVVLSLVISRKKKRDRTDFNLREALRRSGGGLFPYISKEENLCRKE